MKDYFIYADDIFEDAQEFPSYKASEGRVALYPHREWY